MFNSFGIALFFMLLGIGNLSLVRQGYTEHVVLAVAALLAGVRGLWVTAFGGVRVGGDEISMRGWFRSVAVDRRTVEAVVVKRRMENEPEGWLETSTRRVRLRGMSMVHRHAVFGSTSCRECARVVESLELLAYDLGVPLLDDQSGKEAGPV